MYNAVDLCTSGRTLKKGEKVKVRFYPMVYDFRNNIAFWMVPRLRPSGLQVRKHLGEGEVEYRELGAYC
jgi:hypothetical protein